MFSVPRKIVTSISLFLWLLLPGARAIEIVTVPPDLNPGDLYRLVFVTDGVRDATAVEIATYDSFVAAEAAAVPELAGLGVTWSALASTAAIDALNHTHTNPASDGDGVPIYGIDGLRIAAGNADLWNGDLANSGIHVTPTGDVLLADDFEYVFTGTGVLGTEASLADPSDGPLGGGRFNFPGLGRAAIANSYWIDEGNSFHFPAVEQARLYAISSATSVSDPAAPTFADWMLIRGLDDPSADGDGDGTQEIVEYGLSTDPMVPDAPETGQSLVEIDGETFLEFTYIRHRGGQSFPAGQPYDYVYGGVFYRADVTDDVAAMHWDFGAEVINEIGVEPIAGTLQERVTVRVVDASEQSSGTRLFTRITVGLLPQED